MVKGRALQVCADAGVDVTSALMMDFNQLAKRLGVHRFQASACVSEIAVWWEATGAALLKMMEASGARTTA